MTLLEQRPKLLRGARLRVDDWTRSNVLLSPERGLHLNASATKIVLCCTGVLTTREIAAALSELHGVFDAEGRARITHDVLGLVEALHARGLLHCADGSADGSADGAGPAVLTEFGS